VGAPRKTSMTVVVMPDPKDSAKSFRGTWYDDGLLRRTSGVAPYFDPETARYATSDHVMNVVAWSAAGDHPIYLRGDELSSRSLNDGPVHSWKKWLTLDELLKHAWLAKSAPAKAVIIAAYRALRARIDETEA
jgi:hypothetical protein